MEYFELFGLKKEPFSLSPDPDFFYHSLHYAECLQHIEISIRLRRGLNVIIGNMGTGKTTISRVLINQFKNEKDKFLFFLILDPSFNTEYQFLSALIQIFGITPRRKSTFAYKEAIQNFLFRKGVVENKIIVLLIDEGQKLCSAQIEILRNLLNFETNKYKLLQLIILAQLEFLDIIGEHKNFIDRINYSYTIKPLSLEEAKSIIVYRLDRAGLPPGKKFFTDEAIRLIHILSGGYPRKIMNLCHHAMISMHAKGKKFIDLDIIQALQKEQLPIDDELMQLRKNLKMMSKRKLIRITR
ncbi:MAG: ExeA family protein [bacterium]